MAINKPAAGRKAGHKGTGVCRRVLSTLCAFCVTAAMGACKKTENPNVEIETAYAVLQFPKTAVQYIDHKQESEGDAVAEVFYMDVAGSWREVFRICYADPENGSLLGYMKTKQGSVAVSYTVESYTEADFPDQESWQIYYSVMDGFSVLLNSIIENEDFSKTGTTNTNKTKKTKLTYWEFSLPESIRCEERTDNGSYRVDFYGTIAGNEMKMYAIHLGQPAAQTVLGYYTADGEKKTLSVESADLSNLAQLSEKDHILMTSVNDVINVIMSDPNFSAQ